MLRSFFLSLAQSAPLRRFMETSRFARPLTRRFIAGMTLKDALRVERQLEGQGILTALDHLGENVTTEQDAEGACAEILAALDALGETGSTATVAIKLTQFGLDLGEDICRRYVNQVVARARALGTCVEFDMESSAYTERTLTMVKEMHARFGHVRAVLQAYLYRTRDDLIELNRLGIPVRLCKGAYQETATVAFPTKGEVDANFVTLMEVLLRYGVNPAIATHDSRIIRHALRFIRKNKISARHYEFEMLYGIQLAWQQRVVDAGSRLRLYVPYGDAWYPYFMRRLAERPANVLFLASNLLKT